MRAIAVLVVVTSVAEGMEEYTAAVVVVAEAAVTVAAAVTVISIVNNRSYAVLIVETLTEHMSSG